MRLCNANTGVCQDFSTGGGGGKARERRNRARRVWDRFALSHARVWHTPTPYSIPPFKNSSVSMGAWAPRCPLAMPVTVVQSGFVRLGGKSSDRAGGGGLPPTIGRFLKICVWKRLHFLAHSMPLFGVLFSSPTFFFTRRSLSPYLCQWLQRFVNLW